MEFHHSFELKLESVYYVTKNDTTRLNDLETFRFPLFFSYCKILFYFLLNGHHFVDASNFWLPDLPINDSKHVLTSMEHEGNFTHLAYTLHLQCSCYMVSVTSHSTFNTV